MPLAKPRKCDLTENPHIRSGYLDTIQCEATYAEKVDITTASDGPGRRGYLSAFPRGQRAQLRGGSLLGFTPSKAGPNPSYGLGWPETSVPGFHFFQMTGHVI